MHKFYLYVVKKFNLKKKCHLFGFSRGGLYAFNFALSYSEYVASVYLDAPVLNIKSWPSNDSVEQKQLFSEYSLQSDTLARFNDNPIDNLKEFFDSGIPLLIIAGGKDEVVPLNENVGVLLDYCAKNGISVHSVIKPECGHHPHSLDDVAPIIEFVEKSATDTEKYK